MKRMMGMLAGIVIMILVFGSVILLMNHTTADQSEESEQGEDHAAVSLHALRRADMKTIEIASSKGDYQIVLEGETAVIAGILDDYLDSDTIEQVVYRIENIEGQELVREAQDLGQYGLEEPEAGITIQTTERTWQLNIGERIPGDEDGRYAMVKGRSEIYRVNGLDGILMQPLDFSDRTVVGIHAPEGSVPALVVLGGAVRTTDIILGTVKQEDAKMVPVMQLSVLSKNHYGINYESTAEGLSGLLEIEADAVVSYEPSEKEYAEYGLQEPYSTVTYCWEDVNGNSGECSLAASEPRDGSVYLCREGCPLVYRVSASSLPWLEWQYEDVVTRYLLLPDIYSLAEVRIGGSGWSDSYTLKSEGNEVKEVVDSENRVIPVERFKDFYQCLIGIPAEEYTEDFVEEEGHPLLEITFVYRDGREPDRIALLAGPSLQVYLSVNGKADFFTKSRYMDTILENYQNLLTEKEIVALY